LTITGIGANQQQAAISSQAIGRNELNPQDAGVTQEVSRAMDRPESRLQEAGGVQAVQQAQNTITNPALGNLVNLSA
jgi:hypothetical protein